MGIRLDWEIEAEQAHIQRAGEDPVTARRRRLARLRFLLFLLFILAVLGGMGAVVLWRLRAVDVEIEQALRNTVDAEITALRLGDFAAFSQAQRSASQDWLASQQRLFDEYQALKLRNTVQLSGQILDATVDRTRARVSVQEIIDGVPYTRVWFYWRYDDGWRHVPPDYTFWGELKTEQRGGVTVRYRDVDAVFGQALASRVPDWITLACVALPCGELPPVSIEVIPDESLLVSWAVNNSWLLQVPSPYTTRARSDAPFDVTAQLAVASMIADRLVALAAQDMQPTYPADAYYLRPAVASWLVGRFVVLNTNSFLISSLATNYGDAAVGRLLAALRPDSSTAVLSAITGAPLEQSNLDWRDFLTWRLATEADLLERGDETNFIALYDTRDENTRALAYERLSVRTPLRDLVVTAAALETGVDGLPLLRAQVEVNGDTSTGQQEVFFRLVDGSWRRIN
jgi:hypothetical protein